ncbi:ferredoxin [Fundicoccus culcitae]|uniref:Ferredoxin n=1 Tax=Fundicoccus culcitae TaxID=2969821 RepID=A0ABY5P826_9LACT|nr:ferredoxin [Fundicoccus culcitae]UUX34543.1 ferredoxin [Fundicoccus culcitae]
MKFFVKTEKCIACGRCYLNYPDIFDSTDEGIAFVKETANEKDHTASRNVVYECPTRAIQMVEPDAQV